MFSMSNYLLSFKGFLYSLLVSYLRKIYYAVVVINKIERELFAMNDARVIQLDK